MASPLGEIAKIRHVIRDMDSPALDTLAYALETVSSLADDYLADDYDRQLLTEELINFQRTVATALRVR